MIRRWYSLALATFIGSISSCKPAADAASSPSAALTSSPRGAASAENGEPPAPRPLDKTQRRVAESLSRVAAVRRLAPREEVRAREVNRVELEASLRAHLERELPRNLLVYERELLTGLGQIPPDYDYEKGLYQLLGGQVAGFYEYRDKRMYLVTDLDEASAETVLAHELVHALQDQHYDLASRIQYAPEQGDRENAAQALAEGDASSAMIDATAPDSQPPAFTAPDDRLAERFELALEDEVPKDVPRALRASLLAPYVDGILFVHALRRRGAARPGGDSKGWSEVDRAWGSPPDTTEQLLHVEKYDQREPAEKIAPLALPAGSGWKAVFEDTLGEQGLRLAVEQWMPRRTAVAVARGWGGDRATVFLQRPAADKSAADSRSSDKLAADMADAAVVPDAGVAPGTRVAVGWHIRFDVGQKDADSEAREAFRAVASALHPGRDVAGNTLCVERGALGAMAWARSKRDLAVVAGPYERTASGVRKGADCAQTTRWAAEILKSATP